MIDPVFCKSDTTIGTGSGAPLRLQIGQHWPASDPVVKAHPDLFTTDPRYGLRYSVEPAGYHDDVPVEAATAAPGERRSTARARG